MNPPYIRHREIEGYDKERARISLDSKCIIPKSANLYIYFSVKALTLLSKGGRAALLIPGEWMSANFAASFKEFLVRSALLKEIVLFSNCSNVFDDALTTASILLCQNE
jgi:methylase of polypeptide subunit release factors